MTVRKGNAFRQFIHPERIGNRSKAEECYKRLGACERAIITVADRRKCYQRPPLLYDLTTLLQDCCQRLDFSSEQTLETAQALFEKQLISYPRTESRHIPERVMATIPALLERIFRQGEYIEFQRSIDIKRLPGWNVDKRNNHGHHAIIPTGIQPSQNLIEEERQVYRLIVLRMIEAFSPRCEKEQSFVGTNIDGLEFRSRTLHVIRPGWRSICRRVEDRDPHETDDETLVDFMVGEEVEIAACNLGKSHSIPKPFYTEASLLEAMSWAGKEDCAGAKRRVWTQGLGTPAARAGIISELFRRQYIERSAKTIIPTERGLYLYETLKGLLIANVGRTEQLENDLARIERREISPEHFMQALSGYVRQVAEEISSIHFAPAVSSISCPKCQEDRILLQRKLAKCNNENCDFVFSRAVLNKSLTDEQVEQLLTHGQTGVIEGFRNRGRKFDAVLRLDAEFHVRYVPMDKPEQKNT